VPDDLSSIEGLDGRHRRVLARHHVTDLRGLVQADRRVIHRAMANLRPRPTLELISRWQDDARSQLDQAVTDASDWHTAASFVVIFSQRRPEGSWERRTEVERTEVEPERHPQQWPSWDCAPLCTWMTTQLPQPGGPAPGGPPLPVPLPAGPEAAAGRPQLRIDSAALIDAVGRTNLVTSGQPATAPRTELAAPVRVVLTVRGARPGTQLRAVTRVQRPDSPGWNPQDPVTPSASGRAEFDLSGIPAGHHELSLIAWAPDAAAKPVSVRLPPITIHGSRDG
jgi:hypothetical protein